MEVITIEKQAYQELVEMFKNSVSTTRASPKEKDLYDEEAFIELMGISKKTSQRWRDKGDIKFSQVGRKIYYTRKSINEFLEKNKAF